MGDSTNIYRIFVRKPLKKFYLEDRDEKGGG
jgi:hypothetical protein